MLDHFELIRALYNRSINDGYRAFVDPGHHDCWVTNEFINAWLNMICDESNEFAAASQKTRSRGPSPTGKTQPSALSLSLSLQ